MLPRPSRRDCREHPTGRQNIAIIAKPKSHVVTFTSQTDPGGTMMNEKSVGSSPVLQAEAHWHPPPAPTTATRSEARERSSVPVKRGEQCRKHHRDGREHRPDFHAFLDRLPDQARASTSQDRRAGARRSAACAMLHHGHRPGCWEARSRASGDRTRFASSASTIRVTTIGDRNWRCSCVCGERRR